ncbi:alpha/beta hydrolase family protein [Nonomuraea polychroma]|uniref:Alpha/beta hydrolase family protein n=1 Tax=Nonomuraea polychroma TaxID=46176 RepID=A0A438M5K9_9ACTN|nr:alpha/beta hydrolase family protein [Nonomuraea polychroma]
MLRAWAGPTNDWSTVRTRSSLLAAAFVAMATLLPVSAAVAEAPGGATATPTASGTPKASSTPNASGTSTASPSPTASKTPAPGKSSITWAPCEEEPSAECGKLAVPIDWSRPNGAKVELAVARRKATDPAARVGSLVLGAGGPGGSGVEFAYSSPGFFTPEIQKRFDIVGFDPRGVGRSHPITCSASVYNQAPYAVMKSQADYVKWVAFAKKLRADCRARTGPLYDHVDSVNVARDLDALRAALGEEKLTFYGVSYGTLLGQMYAELFPTKIRAMTLDSNMDHSLGVKAFLDSEAAAVEDAFDQFVGWCDQEPSCVLHGKDVRAVWERILAKARDGKLYWPGVPGKPVTELQVLWNGVLGTEGPAWALLAEVLRALDGGEPPSWVPPLPGRQPVSGETAQLATTILCEDYKLKVRSYKEYAFLLRSSKRRAPDMRFNPMPIEDLPVCLNHPTNNPQHRLRYTGSAPILLGNSLHDPSTPYSWSANVAKQLGPKAVLLTYEGWGHRIYGKDECSTVPIDNYLISLTVPPHGFRCPVGGRVETKLKKDQRELWRTDGLKWAGPLAGLPRFQAPAFTGTSRTSG